MSPIGISHPRGLSYRASGDNSLQSSGKANDFVNKSHSSVRREFDHLSTSEYARRLLSGERIEGGKTPAWGTALRGTPRS